MLYKESFIVVIYHWCWIKRQSRVSIDNKINYSRVLMQQLIENWEYQCEIVEYNKFSRLFFHPKYFFFLFANFSFRMDINLSKNNYSLFKLWHLDFFSVSHSRTSREKYQKGSKYIFKATLRKKIYARNVSMEKKIHFTNGSLSKKYFLALAIERKEGYRWKWKRIISFIYFTSLFKALMLI